VRTGVSKTGMAMLSIHSDDFPASGAAVFVYCE
jgi:hypothetical protein